MILEHYDSNEFALLGNFLASEGKQGKASPTARPRLRVPAVSDPCSPHQVLRVEASARKGDGNFVTTIRNALSAKYGDQVQRWAGRLGSAPWATLAAFMDAPFPYL